MYHLDGSAQDDEQDTEHGKEGSHDSGTRVVSHPQHLLKYNLPLELFVTWLMGYGDLNKCSPAYECKTIKALQGIALRLEII
jgi:hypothetical protein